MIIADTGFWVALANARDQHNTAAKAAAATLKSRLITTWPVITETCHVLASRRGHVAVTAFVSAYEAGTFDVFAIVPEHGARLRALIEKYRDLPMDLADASLVLLAEQLGSGDILTTDRRDFGSYRFKNTKPFRNLLL